MAHFLSNYVEYSRVPNMGTRWIVAVRNIAISTLRNFWERNGDAEEPLKAWFREVKSADWATPHQIMTMYRSASVIGDNCIVFNIAGNKYRLIVKFNYPYRIGYVRFVGTHAEYD